MSKIVCDEMLVKQELARVGKPVTQYILTQASKARFWPGDLNDAAVLYFMQSKKCVRPALVLNACSACGGDQRIAMPAAAALESFHTWTLVHDDIIDNDDLRRGSPTVHRTFATKSAKEGLPRQLAEEYGRTIAILSGDILQGFATTLMCSLKSPQVPEKVRLELVSMLAGRVNFDVMEGETIDVQLSFADPEKIDEKTVLNMIAKKTAALYTFAAVAGAIIGTGKTSHRYVTAMASYARNSGIAFQLQDDILGILGNEVKLGKPIGSDIREGKRTLIVLRAFANATPGQKKTLRSTLGNKLATPREVEEVKEIFLDTKAVEKVQRMADAMTDRAVAALKPLPQSRPRDFLTHLAMYVTRRNN